MTDGADLLEVGSIDKAHGLKGEVVVTLTTDVPGRLAPGAVLHAGTRRLEVLRSQPHQHRFIVAFAGLHSREDVAPLHGVALFAEPVEDQDALFVHEVIGAEVRTADGRSWGRVESVEANPASDLLVLENGTLVPTVFVSDDSGLPGHLVIDPPAGLLDDGAE